MSNLYTYPEKPLSRYGKWKFIPGYLGLYKISSSGFLISCKRKGVCRDRLIVPWKHWKGYPTVRLRKNKMGRMFAIHQLVILTFKGKRKQEMETRHLNGIKTDNSIANLRYGTRSENRLDEFKHKPWLRKAISVARIKYWKRRNKK